MDIRVSRCRGAQPVPFPLNRGEVAKLVEVASINRDSGAKSGKPTQGAPKSFWFAESVTLMTAEREGGKSISMGKKSQNFRALAGGKYERTRSSRREADENS